MASEPTDIDATGDPSLARLAREVRDSQRARVIRLGDEAVAVISPIRRRRVGSAPSHDDRQAFLSALGGWKDVDTGRLIEDIYTARRVSDRHPVEL
jgi:hypothetical protein